MRSTFRTLILASFVVLGIGVAEAAPLYSFDLIPQQSVVVGAPGMTIGWGYSLVNNSSDYFVPTAINGDVFANGAPLSLFDFPVVAPNSTAFEAFVANSSGLFQLTWDDAAPLGFVNAGFFSLSADFYSGDPLAGGTFLRTADDSFAGYSATVGPTAIPEPVTLATFVLGLLGVAWLRSRARG